MAAAAAEQQQFYLLLGNLLSPDNVVRKQAEVTELVSLAGAPTLSPTSPRRALAAQRRRRRPARTGVGRAAHV